MTVPAYAELVAASNFSFLRGASPLKALVLTAVLRGHAGLGLADRNTVAGVVRAWSALKQLREDGWSPPEKLRDLRIIASARTLPPTNVQKSGKVSNARRIPGGALGEAETGSTPAIHRPMPIAAVIARIARPGVDALVMISGPFSDWFRRARQ